MNLSLLHLWSAHRISGVFVYSHWWVNVRVFVASWTVFVATKNGCLLIQDVKNFSNHINLDKLQGKENDSIKILWKW